MLTSMRNTFATGFMRWVLIAMLSILMVSFAIWGIGDIFRGFSREKLVTVGSTEITAERFRNEFDRERQNLSRRVGQAVSAEQMRAFGRDEQLLRRLIAEAALDEQARRLGLAVSDAEIARSIVEDPTFAGGGPGFNRAYFNQLLQGNNLSEAAYVQIRRGENRRQQIVTALGGGIGAPQPYQDIMNRIRNERRTVSFVTLEAARLAQVEPPTDQQLGDYYGLVSAAFRSPETRAADVLVLTPQALARRVEVSDDDARQVYDQSQNRFGTPERRQITQATFATREAADAAQAKLAAGSTFDAVMADAATGATVSDLGLLNRGDVLDPGVRDAAFGLAAPGATGVVASRFGAVILNVARIEPGSVQPFEAVAPQIRQELALERARRQVFDLHDRVEEERLSAVRLPEIAQKLGLDLVQIPSMSRAGLDAAGAPLNLPGGRAAVDAVFAAQQGGDNEGVQLRDVGGYIWVDVREIRPEQDRPLEAVRDAVAARWTEEQQRSQVATRAATLVERVNGGAGLQDVAAELGAAVQASEPFTRTGTPPGLPRAAVEEAFRTPENRAGSAPADRGADRTLFVVTKVEVPAVDPANVAELTRDIGSNLQTDILTSYVGRLEDDLGTTINRSALNRIVSGGSLGTN